MGECLRVRMHAQTNKRMLACVVSCSSVEEGSCVYGVSPKYADTRLHELLVGLSVHKDPEHALPHIPNVAKISYYN